jgi:excinuclease ABC subunit C
MELAQKAANLPIDAGVYLFKDVLGNILYVGKSHSLRNRVRSYFLESRWLDAKTGSLVREIADLEYIVVDNDREALALENNLIKQHKPKFNVLLRDDKTYPYIRFTARICHPPPGERRLDLFRPFFPAQPRVPDRPFHSQDVSRSLVHGGLDARPSETLFAVLHSQVPRSMRPRTHLR